MEFDNIDDELIDTIECPHCGALNDDDAEECFRCLEELDDEFEYVRPTGQPGVERLLIPVGRPISAIAAGYLGLFALIPIPIFSLGALICGIVAFKKINANPDLVGKGRSVFGIVMGSIFTLLYTAMWLMIAIEAAR